MGRVVAVAGVLWCWLALSAAALAAAPPPEPYEDAARSYRNVLPPGQNGHATASQIATFLSTGSKPPHNDDQLGIYEDLVFASPGLSRSQLPNFFKDGSFGVAPGDVEAEYQPCGTAGSGVGNSDSHGPCALPPVDDGPCADVTIQRDDYGVPHITGATRAGAMCGAGYIAAEDRMFLIDALRHAGRAELSSFAGGAEGNRSMDREQWRIAPYREADLQQQIDQFDELYGAQGRKLQRDLAGYVAGLNQYREEALANSALKLDGTYAAIGKAPEPFEGTDVVAIASLVGGIFGKGGGGELDSAQFLRTAQQRFGRREGEAVWEDFRSAEDREAPTTVHEERFPYQVRPQRPRPGSLAIPDRGSLEETEVVAGSSTGAAGRSGADAGAVGGGLLGGTLAFPDAQSNALLVSASESRSGHPIAVFGPQTGYFSPQLLLEMDIHGPGIDARGAAFAGTNLYVQLGRGVDYAWSATSAGQDNIDTFALELCEPGGGTPSLDSEGYRYRGSCRPFQVLERRNQWTPSAADQTPPGSETLVARRTALGLETARATLDGRPVVYVKLRSTYGHEVDSARGFADINNPNKVTDARSYQRAAHKIGYTFNWFYADDTDIAYFNSGENPVRRPNTDPNFPVFACPTAACENEWRGYRPIRTDGSGNRALYTPYDRHPQVVNQRFLTSWNNKQAPGFRASDSNYGYHSVYRSEPLDDRIERGIRGGRTMTLVELVDAMEDAGTVDLRGDKVLPWALEVLNRRVGSDKRVWRLQGRAEGAAKGSGTARIGGPEAIGTAGAENLKRFRRARRTLARWHEDGAHRRDRDGDGRYEHSRAIQLMDAWWPRLLRAQFKPVLGGRVFNGLREMQSFDNEPNNGGAHLGSAYQGGWYGYASKDLRSVLGKRVRGEYSHAYCGGGSLRRCKERLRRSLIEATYQTREQLYGDDDACEDEPELDDQYCFDTIFHRPVGAITQPPIHWINRPTFQQVVEIRDGR